jgi:hypothetical protein
LSIGLTSPQEETQMARHQQRTSVIVNDPAQPITMKWRIKSESETGIATDNQQPVATIRALQVCYRPS